MDALTITIPNGNGAAASAGASGKNTSASLKIFSAPLRTAARVRATPKCFSQFLIEGVFKEMKDRSTGNWWPMFHWTDSKIQVHALYCTIAVLLRALLWRRVRQAGLQISLKRLLGELQDIREIVNTYPGRGKQKEARRQTVLSKRNEVQERLLLLLGLPEGAKKAVLG